MPRLIVFNDPHFALHPPECRGPNYARDVLEKFHAAARIAKAIGAKTIACTGDWYHRKGKVTFAEANDVLTVLRSWRDSGLDVVGILGNHDIAGHSLDSLDSRAVGTMVRSRVLHLLDHDPYLSEDGDGKLWMTGTSYFHGCDSSDEARLRMYGARRDDVPEGAVHVHLAHGTLVQRGEFFEDHTSAPDLVELLAAHDRLPDVIVCGHLHYDEGVKLYKRPGGGKVAVARIGSLTRVSVDDFDRIPKVLVVAVKDGNFACKEKEVGLPLEVPKAFGGEADGETTSEHDRRIKDFVGVLRETSDRWEVSDHRGLLREVCERMDFEEDVLKLAIESVERHQ